MRSFFRIALLTALFAGLFAAISTRAQTYTIPQNVVGVVMNQVTAPTTTPIGAGATQCSPPVSAGNTCQIPALGQNVHLLTYLATNATFNDIRLEGSLDGVTYFPISADGTSSSAIFGTTLSGSVCALGSYASIRANLVALTGSSASITATYVGTSAVSPSCPLGSYNPAQSQTSMVFTRQNISVTTDQYTGTPFANAYATMVYQYTANVATDSLSVSATNSIGVDTPLFTQTLAVGSNTVTINLPPFPTSRIHVRLTPGTSSLESNVESYIVFSPPPVQQAYSSTNITTATSTAIKGGAAQPGAGILHNLTVNTGVASSTAIIYDGPISGGVCSGTKLGTLSTAAPGNFPYDLQFSSGLCIVTSSTADITVTWR